MNYIYKRYFECPTCKKETLCSDGWHSGLISCPHEAASHNNKIARNSIKEYDRTVKEDAGNKGFYSKTVYSKKKIVQNVQ